MSYVPVVDDYVKWRNVEGWVYYVGEEYITIEVAVKDKPDNYVMFHKKVHCNIVCPCWNWDELKYITNRREPVRGADDMLSQYKSQTDRYLDP